MIRAQQSISLLLVFLCGCYGHLTGTTVIGLVTAETVIVAAPSELTGEDMRIKGNYDGIFVLGEPSHLSSFHTESENLLVALHGEQSECDSVIAELEAVCGQHLESYDLSSSLNQF